MIADIVTHVCHWFAATWRTQDGPFLLVVLPGILVFAGLLAANS